MKKFPIAIASADWHLRDDTPRCRKDDFAAAQWHKVEFAVRLAYRNNCPLLVAGDVFHSPRPSAALLADTLRAMKSSGGGILFLVPGNHDLPWHSMEYLDRSGLAILNHTVHATVLHGNEGADFRFGNDAEVDYFGIGFGEKIDFKKIKALGKGDMKILLYHEMVFPKRQPPWPGCKGVEIEELERLAVENGIDFIVTGDNHRTHATKHVVNCGSLTRQTADQTDHVPVVWMLYSDGTKEPVELPHDKDVFQERPNGESSGEQRERFEAFVRSLKDGDGAALSFRDAVLAELDRRSDDVPVAVADFVRAAFQQ